VLVRACGSAFLVGATFGSLLLACERRTPAERNRSVPVCATQDCATGRIVDDGCTEDRRCASCVNACPSALVIDGDGSRAVPEASVPVPATSISSFSEGDAGDFVDAAPAPPQQLRALAGKGTGGVFWIPVKGDFPFEDLMLLRDGHYFTHLHEHPASSGTWRMDGDTLTLDAWMGDGQYVLRAVHVDAHELRGLTGSTPIVLHRKW
jgi:ferredoxin